MFEVWCIDFRVVCFLIQCLKLRCRHRQVISHSPVKTIAR